MENEDAGNEVGRNDVLENIDDEDTGCDTEQTARKVQLASESRESGIEYIFEHEGWSASVTVACIHRPSCLLSLAGSPLLCTCLVPHTAQAGLPDTHCREFLAQATLFFGRCIDHDNEMGWPIVKAQNARHDGPQAQPSRHDHESIWVICIVVKRSGLALEGGTAILCCCYPVACLCAFAIRPGYEGVDNVSLKGQEVHEGGERADVLRRHTGNRIGGGGGGGGCRAGLQRGNGRRHSRTLRSALRRAPFPPFP